MSFANSQSVSSSTNTRATTVEPLVQATTSSLLGDLLELVKARLSFLVLLTTFVGFFLGWKGPLNYLILTATLFGTALNACGASALNQWWERSLDAMMKRTCQRPLPAGRLHPSDALLFGILCSIVGTSLLFIFVNTVSASLALATILLYVLIYTPLKRYSTLNTLIGAIPGAIPPLVGWTAATGNISFEGGILFLILWFWQIPHFLAIAWLYRHDYASAGFCMLSVEDKTGLMSARQALIYSLGLMIVSLSPFFIGLENGYYLIIASLLGIGFIAYSVLFLKNREEEKARSLFLASIIYLPAILLALLIFRIG